MKVGLLLNCVYQEFREREREQQKIYIYKQK